MLETGDRAAGGMTAPAVGLTHAPGHLLRNEVSAGFGGRGARPLAGAALDVGPHARDQRIAIAGDRPVVGMGSPISIKTAPGRMSSAAARHDFPARRVMAMGTTGDPRRRSPGESRPS